MKETRYQEVTREITTKIICNKCEAIIYDMENDIGNDNDVSYLDALVQEDGWDDAGGRPETVFWNFALCNHCLNNLFDSFKIAPEKR